MNVYRRLENPDATAEEAEQYCSQNLEGFMQEIDQCMLVNNFFWTMWAIVTLKENQETDHTLFNWELCRQRYVLASKQKEWFGLGTK